MSSHSPRLPRGPGRPSARAHRRRRPVTPYADVPWDSLRAPFVVGVTPDATVAKSLGCRPQDVARYRDEHGIEAPGTEGDGGRWPTDDELRAENEAAADLREAEVRLYPLRSSAWWMDGRLGSGEDEHDAED